MIKNKFILTSGILMVVTASIAILSVIANTELFVENLNILNSGIYLPDTIDYALIEMLSVTYLLQCALYLFIAISFMLLGIKLIKSVKRGKIVAEIKGKVIVSLVFVSVASFFEMCIGTLSIANIVTIVLLSIALGKSGSEKIERDEMLLKNRAEMQADLEEDMTENHKAENEECINNLDNNSEIDIITEKIVRLNTLKQNGVITTEEFELLVADVLNVKKTDNIRQENLTTQKDTNEEIKNNTTKKRLTNTKDDKLLKDKTKSSESNSKTKKSINTKNNKEIK